MHQKQGVAESLTYGDFVYKFKRKAFVSRSDASAMKRLGYSKDMFCLVISQIMTAEQASDSMTTLVYNFYLWVSAWSLSLGEPIVAQLCRVVLALTVGE